MKILSIDTSTECATCSLIDENKIFGEISYNDKKQHSVVLMPMIEELLLNTKHKISDIDAFVVSKGPGSFTGLRIGMSVIKGLAQGSKKPFISVSSLDALANNFPYFNGIICSMMDALRDNIYCSLYTFDNGSLQNNSDYLAISIDELIELLKSDYPNENILFVGDGTYKFKDILTSNLSNICFAPSHLNFVRSSSLGMVGLELLQKGIEDNIYSSAPIYLKKSQAEREYDEKKLRESNV